MFLTEGHVQVAAPWLLIIWEPALSMDMRRTAGEKLLRAFPPPSPYPWSPMFCMPPPVDMTHFSHRLLQGGSIWKHSMMGDVKCDRGCWASTKGGSSVANGNPYITP